MFPQYLDVFCDVTGKTSTMILRQYGTPDKILRGHKKTMIEKYQKLHEKVLPKLLKDMRNSVLQLMLQRHLDVK
ncbi:MAG: hypothetical protein ACLR8Q_13965 [[Ruminococcus] lactaris]|uniref:hypothetical protein n=1 Tax=[Ruminococcus] lactaris TaxID=46228 RepID=UPI0039A396CA